MKRIDVYRIQDSGGYGPYAGRQDIDCDQWQEEVHSYQECTPGPADDSGLLWWIALDEDERDTYKFGFESLEALNAWFKPTEIYKLKCLGFFVCRLQAAEVKSTNYQSVFRGLITLKEEGIDHERLDEKLWDEWETETRVGKSGTQRGLWEE